MNKDVFDRPSSFFLNSFKRKKFVKELEFSKKFFGEIFGKTADFFFN